MAVRKTDPQPFPTRGTPSGYRDIWDVDDRTVLEAQIAERERQAVARDVAASHRRGKSRDAGETTMCIPRSPAEDLATGS
jgi:hypothetical protein